jgi:cold shock CspA family protein
MKGKVINFNQEKSFGFILGENGQNYFFHTSDVNLPFEVKKNKMLTFKPSKNQKGLCAKNVVLEKGKQNNNNSHKDQKQQRQSQQKKKKFVMIGDITVNLNDVKSAQLQYDSSLGKTKLLIRTYSSGILVGYYTCSNMARNDLKKLLSQL